MPAAVAICFQTRISAVQSSTGAKTVEYLTLVSSLRKRRISLLAGIGKIRVVFILVLRIMQNKDDFSVSICLNV